jgi:hypothetical protein
MASIAGPLRGGSLFLQREFGGALKVGRERRRYAWSAAGPVI